MDRNKRGLFRKRSGSFKKKGSNHKKVRSTSHEGMSGTTESSDTVYRILCPSNKIGGVIGKGGGVIKALREETRAKITVSDAVFGSDERVIIIYNPPTKISKKGNSDEEGSGADNEEQGDLEPQCAAQDALLKVHDKILEEDLFGGMTFDDDNDGSDVTIRLLVPNNMVGCVLGKKGDVIQQLRRDTGAGIRVLPSQHLPTCAMSTDELVQITGKPDVAKRALFDVSTRLHQNPRKDQQPLNISILRSGQVHHSGGAIPNGPPIRSPVWTARNSDSYGTPPKPWMGEHGHRPSGFVHGGYDDFPVRPVGEPSEFCLKILCSGAKIRGVIGRGGCNVKQLEQETGASVHVEDASSEDEERVIRVSAVEAIWDPRSQTIDAILQLQNKASDFSEDGTITTKLLVPSSKVGCLLGQGGHVINEMRRRTRADIRVISKDDKPRCASEEEELVQVSGNLAVARDALAEILSRLRVRALQDTNAGGRPAPLGPPLGLASGGSFRDGRPSGPIAAGGSGGYERYKCGEHVYDPLGYPGPRAAAGFLPSSKTGIRGGGGHECEPRLYPGPRAAAGYPDVSSSFELRIANNSLRLATGVSGTNMLNVGEMAGARTKHQNPQPSGSELLFESHGSSTHSMYDPYMNSAAPSTKSEQLHSYQPTSASQGSHQQVIEQQDSYSMSRTRHSQYSHEGGYRDANAAYQDISAHQGSYQY